MRGSARTTHTLYQCNIDSISLSFSQVFVGHRPYPPLGNNLAICPTRGIAQRRLRVQTPDNKSLPLPQAADLRSSSRGRSTFNGCYPCTRSGIQTDIRPCAGVTCCGTLERYPELTRQHGHPERSTPTQARKSWYAGHVSTLYACGRRCEGRAWNVLRRYGVWRSLIAGRSKGRSTIGALLMNSSFYAIRLDAAAQAPPSGEAQTRVSR